MDISMVCVICTATVEIKDLEELKLDKDTDAIDIRDFDCPICNKTYWIGG